MATVTYVGQSPMLVHRGSGTDLTFCYGVPEKVPLKVAQFYENEAKFGGPWKVEYGPGEAMVNSVENVAEEAKAIGSKVKKKLGK